MNLPEPGTEDFYKLGPQARKLSRWRHETTSIRTENSQKTRKSLIDFQEEGKA